MPTSRHLALAALRRWREGAEFADQIISESLGKSDLSRADRAFALELFYGVLRNLTLLDFWIANLRPAPVDPATRDLLRLGLYQILLISTATHAAVFETVELAPRRARPVVNAVLRRAVREKIRLTNLVARESPAVQFSEPGFLIERWKSQFGLVAAFDLCRWNNDPAPVYARINELQISASEFRKKYPESEPLPHDPLFVRLSGLGSGLTSGDYYIQDPSTALACRLLDPQPNEIVLDACAAPGGKSALLAGMMQNAGQLIAVDRDESRLNRLRDNLVRLGIKNTTVIRADWLEAEPISPARIAEKSFNKILLDAPCSNTGVMRRRVDVRWRLSPGDFERMQRQQLAMLKNLAQLLRPGGSLVYSTCSLEPEENEEVIEKFLSANPAFRLTKTESSLPWRDGFDGAFAARLHRPVAVE